MKRKLRKLTNKEFVSDVKRFIKTPHEFYKSKTPELKTMSKRLHEEYSLKQFYRVFDKLWYSSNQNETTLALNSLELYKEEFNLETWKFLRPKINEIRSFDQADIIGKQILSNILLKYPKFGKEILRYSKSENVWKNRIAIMSVYELVKKNKIKFLIFLTEFYNSTNERAIKEAIGEMLKHAEKYNKEKIKKFLLKNIHKLPYETFHIATENVRELRKLRKIKRF